MKLVYLHKKKDRENCFKVFRQILQIRFWIKHHKALHHQVLLLKLIQTKKKQKKNQM